MSTYSRLNDALLVILDAEEKIDKILDSSDPTRIEIKEAIQNCFYQAEAIINVEKINAFNKGEI